MSSTAGKQRCQIRLVPSPTAAANLAIGRNFDKYIKLTKSSAFFERICTLTGLAASCGHADALFPVLLRLADIAATTMKAATGHPAGG
ncbi:hypothetical protein FOVG_17162 [Fusarium oxysporum f. sp. pisi HDV247]|uniref:Uncharacterized protein n=1 Tax=Fusarium oxysporum f. sp. pisi HDV247 TaxID=1080344 RepID=W9NLC0_FUSOX|nr:hypothetical protein FOVG_17162 [Fusarium oxysporum f. sp. pisi HDV247]